MATERRPSRPATRVPQPGSVHSAPTTRMPQKSSGGPPTRSMRTGGGSTRSVPSAKKSNLPVILGAAGGGLLLIILVAVAFSGGSSAPPASNQKKKAAGPPNVAALEREAETKCEQGLALIQKCEGLMSGRTLNAGEKTQLRTDLDKGVHLIQEGMNKFDEANAKSGNMYDTTKYGKAYKAAKMKLGELK